MAGLIQILSALITLGVKLFDLWREKDLEKKKLKGAALDTVKAGLAERDASKLTLGFDAFNRV